MMDVSVGDLLLEVPEFEDVPELTFSQEKTENLKIEFKGRKRKSSNNDSHPLPLGLESRKRAKKVSLTPKSAPGKCEHTGPEEVHKNKETLSSKKQASISAKLALKDQNKRAVESFCEKDEGFVEKPAKGYRREKKKCELPAEKDELKEKRKDKRISEPESGEGNKGNAVKQKRQEGRLSQSLDGVQEGQKNDMSRNSKKVETKKVDIKAERKQKKRKNSEVPTSKPERDFGPPGTDMLKKKDGEYAQTALGGVTQHAKAAIDHAAVGGASGQRKVDLSNSRIATGKHNSRKDLQDVNLEPSADNGDELRGSKMKKGPPEKSKKSRDAYGTQRAVSMKDIESEPRMQQAASRLPCRSNPGQIPEAEKIQKGGKLSLVEKMRAKLTGGKFRMLNETLYTCKGEEAFQLFQKDVSAFAQYHVGYREQMSRWPQQPIDSIVQWLHRRGPSLRVADFGCGDAKLSESVPNKVFSLDLVAAKPGVIACNMAKTPLASGSVDVAVFCLSLMGTDYPKFLEEAARLLSPKGWVLIAEVKSRFDPANGGADPGQFTAAMVSLGFRLHSQNMSNKMFVMFEFVKASAKQKVSGATAWPSLKACVYKKR